MHRYDVIGLGNAIVDVIAPADDSFLLEHHVAKGVMTLVEEHRMEALQRSLRETKEISGGSAANTMAGIASLGGRAKFIGKVKKDRLGESFARGLHTLGVDYTAEMAGGGPATACSLILVTPDGHRSMNTYLGASRELGPADIRNEDIVSAKVLYVEGYLWDAPAAKAAIAAAIAAARGANTQVAFTLSDPFCVERWREEFTGLLPKLDILFANEEEAKALFACGDLDDVFQAIRSWHGTAVITRSEKGCVVVRKGEVHILDAVPVQRVVDTTGAGDQFAAGVLYGVTQGKTLPDCGRLGALAAAEVISHYGARPETSLRTLAAEAGLV